MKNKFSSFIPLIILVFSFIDFACSSCKTESDSPIISVKVKEMNIWLNLMPGGSPSFHFSGTTGVTNNTKYEIKHLLLSEVDILFHDEILYRIKPESDEELNYNLSSDSEQSIKFYSPQNIKVDPDLHKADSLNVVLKFLCDEKIQTVNVGIFPLERAY